MDKFLSCDHSKKAIEQYFPVVLFIKLFKEVLTLETVDEILKSDLIIQMKAAEQYFPVVLFLLCCVVNCVPSKKYRISKMMLENF